MLIASAHPDGKKASIVTFSFLQKNTLFSAKNAG
jgi:hypothetical protein